MVSNQQIREENVEGIEIELRRKERKQLFDHLKHTRNCA